MSISKSQYLKGLQCHRRLWLSKHKPELAKPISEAQQFIFDQGIKVGEIAQGLFAGGIEIKFNPSDFVTMISKTKELLENHNEITIYEATFNHEGSFAMVDILVQTSEGLEVYEVKSGTTAKEVNISDLAFQVYVLQGLGYTVNKAALIYINNEYIRQEQLNLNDLFVIEDLTDEMPELTDPVRDLIAQMTDTIKGSEPNIDIGLYCKKPFECEFKHHCWSHVLESSVLNLFDARGKDWELYRKGIFDFKDVPLDSRISPKHKEQIDSYLNKEIHVNKKAIETFLSTIEYPISFLDFETYQEAIPTHPGTRSYEQIPFQYSLHILNSIDSEIDHHEFLAESGTDPKYNFITALLNVLPKEGSIVVYNQSFEAGILRKLAKLFPEYELTITEAIDRLVDIMQVFKSRWYYHWQFQGSYSIKNVLPALVPELSYEDLDIGEGASASRSFIKLGTLSEEEAIKVTKNLLEYCKLDTFAMVAIFKELKALI